MKKGKWKNGKRIITGLWEYVWSSDRFYVILDSKDRITGENKKVVVTGDTPEWGNWRLIRDE